MAVLEGISFLTALAAAVFWFWSAAIQLPAPGTYWTKAPENDPFLMAIRHSANLNGIAAILTGISVVMSGVTRWVRNLVVWIPREHRASFFPPSKP
jgi:hypothetical protein